mmetsp:Transcript_1952/g.3045  ORF Transcript_1952/g.3045 Transcript_1952/m.3045 type:complete len:86 (+) Transcript_1952:282-539(+)
MFLLLPSVRTRPLSMYSKVRRGRQSKKNSARIVDRTSSDDARYGQEHDISVDTKTKVHDSFAPSISIFLMRQRVQHGSSRVCESL